MSCPSPSTTLSWMHLHQKWICLIQKPPSFLFRAVMPLNVPIRISFSFIISIPVKPGPKMGPICDQKKTSGKSVQRCDKRSFPNVLKCLDSQHLDHILESLLVLGPDGFFEPSSPTQRACRSDSNLSHKSLPLDSAAPLLRVMLRYWYLWPFCNLHGRSSKTTNKSGSAPLSDSACEISWQKLYALAVTSILSCQAAYSSVFSFLRPMHALHDHLAGSRVQEPTYTPIL